MAKTFRYRHLLSSTQNAVPTTEKLLDGEIAVNNYAGEEKLFIKNSTGGIIPFVPEHTIDAKINALDKAASSADGEVVITVVQENGLVSEQRANVKDLQLGGYSNDSSTGEIQSADTINTALSKLENKIGANSITNEDNSIVVTPPTGSATTTDIKVNIKTDEKVIQLGNDGIFTDIKISGLTAAEIQALGDENVKEAYKLLDSTGGTLGDIIKIYKDSSLYSVYIGHVDDTLFDDEDPTSIVDGSGDTALCFIYQLADGTYNLVAVNVEDFLQESEFADGLQVNNHVVSVKIDTASEEDSQSTPEPFLTVGPDGVKVQGIKDEIDRKIDALDVTGDTAVAGQYVAAIEETDGLVAVKTRANVSDAVLNNYVSGTTNEPVAATDTLNQAIGKLENQITAATHDLDEEIAARKAVDGQSGQTYAANSDTNYLSSATSLNDADVKLDAAIKGVQDELDTTQAAAGLNSDGTYSADTNSHYLSSATSLTDADSKLDSSLFELSGSVTDIVEGLDYTDSAVTNQWVTKVDESNGVIAPTRSYISVTNLTTDGDPDFTTGSTIDEIILSAGSF